MDNVENSQKQRDRNYDVTLFFDIVAMVAAVTSLDVVWCSAAVVVVVVKCN